MNYLDIACYAILMFFTFFGYFKGFFRQFIALASLILAYIFAPVLGPHLTLIIQGFVPLPEIIVSRIALAVAGLLVFVVSNLIAKFIQNYLINSFALTKFMNRVGGSLFGLVKGMCLVYLFFVVVSWHPKADAIFAETKVFKVIDEKIASKVRKIPDIEIKQKQDAENKLKDLLDELERVKK